MRRSEAVKTLDLEMLKAWVLATEYPINPKKADFHHGVGGGGGGGWICFNLA